MHYYSNIFLWQPPESSYGFWHNKDALVDSYPTFFGNPSFSQRRHKATADIS